MQPTSKTNSKRISFLLILFFSSVLLHAQSPVTSITDYVIWAGASTSVQPLQTVPAAPGLGVQVGSSTIQGGSVGSYTLIRSVETMNAGISTNKTNLYNGGTVVLANSNVVNGKITAANNITPSVAMVFSAGKSENFTGNIDVNGNIVIGGGTVVGTVTNPTNKNYTLGAVTKAGTGTPTLPVLPTALPIVTIFPAAGTSDITTSSTISPKSYGNLTIGGNVTVTLNGYLIFRAGGITFNGVTSYPTVTDQAIPNGRIVADNNVSSPITNFDVATNTWITRVPLGYASTSDIFITGAIINSSTGFVAINSKANSVLKGMFYTNRTFSDQWSYAMGAYQPQFNYNAISAPGAVASINGTYRSGTPIPVRTFIVSGGTGNGGNNYTGSSSNQNAFTACIPSSLFDVNKAMLSTIKPEKIGEVSKEIMDIYPDPATDNVRLSVVPATTGRSKITLLNIDGKRVLEINNGVTEAGSNYVKNIDVSKLASGVYIIQLVTGYKTTIKKVIITR